MTQQAKEVKMNTEPTIHSLMAELKTHISKELQNAVVEKPMSVKEIAAYYGVHENTIYIWMRDESIPFHKLNGRTYFLASECKEKLLKN